MKRRRVQFYLDPDESALADRFCSEHNYWSISELAYRAFMSHIHRYMSQSEARAKNRSRGVITAQD